jgi:hypothetical protein
MKNKKTQILSFVGGLVFFSVVAAVLLAKNEKLRKEIESQANSLLETSKSVIGQVQFVAEKVGKISGELKTVNANSNSEEASQKALSDGYDSLWQETEEQALEYSNNKMT